MKTVTLNTLVHLTNWSLSINLRCGTIIGLENETCHYLFSTRKEKNEFINGINKDGLLIFNCNNSDYGFTDRQQNSDIPTFDKLLRELQELMKSDTIDVILKTLLIDNISIFFWDLRCLNSKNHSDMGHEYDSAKIYYSELVRLIHEIKEKFKCNVIITSWDIRFDKGYNASWKNRLDISSLDSLSYLPSYYLLSFDHILHRDDSHDRYYRKSIQKWIILNKDSLQD